MIFLKEEKLFDQVCYVDMNEEFTDGIYNNPDRLGLYKEYSLLADDISISDVPNIGYREKITKRIK